MFAKALSDSSSLDQAFDKKNGYSVIGSIRYCGDMSKISGEGG